jgi:hypothetical protein
LRSLEELVDFLAHGDANVSFSGTFRITSPPLKMRPMPRPPGDADVGAARLAGPVHLAPHDGDVDLLVQAA